MSLNLAAVPSQLEQWKGSRVFFVPLLGNHGDNLIELGSREVLRRLSAVCVDDARAAEVIVVNGGGGFARGFFDHGYSKLIELSITYPSKPLVLLPSSIYFDDPERELWTQLRKRRAPVWLYLRDPISFARLEALRLPQQVNLVLDHDMAFYLSGSAMLENWKRKLAQVHLLVVERFDLEQSTRGNPCLDWVVLRERWLRRRFVHWACGLAERGRLGRTEFFEKASQLHQRNCSNWRKQTILYRDIALLRNSDFAGFVRAVCRSSLIVTTRLHVGILGALLGKCVYMQPSLGRYRKIEGVYRHSLAHFSSLKLLEPVGSSLKENAELVQERERRLYTRSQAT